MKPGYVRIDEYEAHLRGTAFAAAQRASRRFLDHNRVALAPYARRWVQDPLHQWSRAWEYPFTAHWLERTLPPGPCRIVDAGSGVTFFPFHVAGARPDLRVECVDQDATLSTVFAQLQDAAAKRVSFRARPLNDTGLPSAQFDAIYCISVLEHARDHDQIAAEFHRLLRPSGHLIVTLDVSLDERSEIPLPRFRELLKTLGRHFAPVEGPSLETVAALDPSAAGEDIVTTEATLGRRPHWLPWRYPRLSGAWGALKQRQWPRLAIKNLSFVCLVLRALR